VNDFSVFFNPFLPLKSALTSQNYKLLDHSLDGIGEDEVFPCDGFWVFGGDSSVSKSLIIKMK